MKRRQTPRILLTTALLLLLLISGGRTVEAAEWQWSAEVTSVVSDETKAHPRAFLWVPPDCKQVRGVVLGQHNMIEEGILEHPAMRRTLAEIGFAEVWVTPAFDGIFRFDKGAGEHFQKMMDALAEVSGYSELKVAPVVPIGHSAMASFPYHFAAWNPQRTLAAISHKGTWPDFRADDTWPPRHAGDLDGVPLLFFNGEYEDADGRAAKALEFRRRNPKCPLTMCADAGGGHFDFHDRMVEYLALYIRTAAKHRLPEQPSPDGAVPLKPIDSTVSGWLAERWRRNAIPKVAPAPLANYKGDATQAFWFFDGELAKATEAYNAREIGKKPQLLGYIQDGRPVPQDAPHTHQQVSLKFLPIDNGLTFKLAGTFLDTVPDGRPETWTGLPAGSHVDHATGGGPVEIDRICGPVEKLAPDTFAVRFYRMGLNNPKRTGDIWLMATHPGDGQFKRAVQQAELRIPFRNKDGADQRITFPPVPDQRAGATSVKLAATSSADAQVHYYVREGPAEIDGDTVRFTPVPPRAKYPVKVTVVAWQWGRSIEPKLKSAEPVERTFSILPALVSGAQ
jgi:hypothetical protein